jgi:hypothetical protein
MALITLLDVANTFICGSGFFMFYTAYRDRDILRGYSLPGTVLISLAVTFMLAFYAQEDYWLSFFLTLPNYGYWLVVLISLMRKRGLGCGATRPSPTS